MKKRSLAELILIGLVAAGVAASAGVKGGGGGMENNASNILTINGGYVVIDSGGDGLDSNGSMYTLLKFRRGHPGYGGRFLGGPSRRPPRASGVFPADAEGRG